tara:strand:+ start:4643 stop:6547 length:1905 start_codon:yes stop_codon:yes gene_type:complete
VKLLACRKLIAHYIVHEMEQKGEKPSSEKVMSEIQRRVRNRGHKLAIKGMDDSVKLNFVADEQLIVSALIHGVSTGRETIILTQDADLLEQFYKLGYLIDIDYRAALISQYIEKYPHNISSQELPEDVFPEMTESGPKEFLKLPKNFIDKVLPQIHHSSTVSCIKLGGQSPNLKYSQLSYCVESEMLLAMKERSKDGNRVILCVSPPFPESFGGNVLLAKDRLCNIYGYKFSVIDLNYTLQEVEHFKKIEVSENAPAESDLVGLMLGVPLVERLCFSEIPKWQNVSINDISVALKNFNPSANIFTDQFFLSSHISKSVDQILVSKALTTTKNIRDWVIKKNLLKTELIQTALNKQRGVRVFDTATQQYYQGGYGYYLAMLGFRKLFWKYIKNKVQQDYHRESPDEEWPQIVEHYTGIRGRKVAEAGWQQSNNESLFFGEELLSIGVLDGIYDGTDALFLTCDPVFMDQFIMLGEYLQSHYLASELGRDILNNGETRGSESVQYNLSLDWKDYILPNNPCVLSIHCWLFDTSAGKIRICPLVFSLESSMHRLLSIKGKTSGLNIDDPYGRNIRIVNTSPNHQRAYLSKELMVSKGSNNFPEDSRLDTRLSKLPALDLREWERKHEDFSPVWYNNT